MIMDVQWLSNDCRLLQKEYFLTEKDTERIKLGWNRIGSFLEGLSSVFSEVTEISFSYSYHLRLTL